MHTSKELTSGQAKKASFTWSYGIIVVCITSVHSDIFQVPTDHFQIRGDIVNIGGLTWRISGSIGVKIPFLGYRQLASFSGILSVPKVSGNQAKQVVIPFNIFGFRGSVTFFVRDRALWVRLVVSSRFINVNREFRLIKLCKSNVYWMP